MEYSINRLSKMSGVSTRTLRYYDEIDLLKPLRVSASGYRIYGSEELEILQQILFYKELNFPLGEIKKFLSAPDYDKEKVFMEHLVSLKRERERLDMLIRNVTVSIAAMRGELTMKDTEKFEGFKQNMIDENEKKYGKEIRRKYGDDTVNKSNRHFKGLTQEQYEKGEELRQQLEETLRLAFEAGNPESELAWKACDLHRRWLCVYYPAYTKEYHKGLADMYVADERFRANYDKIAPGCTEFLRDAIYAYCRR